MAGVSPATDGRVSGWAVLKDIGWLPLLLAGVGGLSIIDILEQIAFGELTLITPFELLLAGYQRLTVLICVLVEPLVRPLLRWANEHWQWRLELQAFWRSLFVLGMVFVCAWARRLWSAGRWLASMAYVSVMLPSLLLASIVIGLLPLTAGWWAHGLASALPVATMAVGHRTMAVPLLGRGTRPIGRTLRRAALFGVAAFALGAAVSLLPWPRSGGGILCLGAIVALSGAVYLAQGLRAQPEVGKLNMGLSILGGFVAAALILVADWAVKASG